MIRSSPESSLVLDAATIVHSMDNSSRCWTSHLELIPELSVGVEPLEGQIFVEVLDVADGVRGQVGLARRRQPLEHLAHREGEDGELLALVQPLLARRPHFQDAVLLAEQLLQNACTQCVQRQIQRPKPTESHIHIFHVRGCRIDCN